MAQRNTPIARPLARRVRWLTCAASVLFVASLSTPGCANSAPPTTQRANSLLNDPVNYNPNADDFPSVSGGGTSRFDKKGFKRDLDSVFNP